MKTLLGVRKKHVDALAIGNHTDLPFEVCVVDGNLSRIIYRDYAEDGQYEINCLSHLRDDERQRVAEINGLRELKWFLEKELSPIYIVSGVLSGSAQSQQGPVCHWGLSHPRRKPALIVFEAYGLDVSHEAIWSMFCEIDPNLQEVGYLAAPSPYSNIYEEETGVQLTGDCGYRFYCIAETGGSIQRYGQLFSMRSWVHGFSRVVETKSGKSEIRGLVNVEAFEPSYPLTEMRPLLEKGLMQIKRPIAFKPGGALRVGGVEGLTNDEATALVNACAESIAICPLTADEANVYGLAGAIWRGANRDAWPQPR